MAKSDIPESVKLRLKTRKSSSVERLEAQRLKREKFISSEPNIEDRIIHVLVPYDRHRYEQEDYLLQTRNRFSKGLDEDSSLAQEYWAGGGGERDLDYGIKIDELS